MENYNDRHDNLRNAIDSLNPSLIKDLENEIVVQLNKASLFYRTFGRIKSSESTERKLREKGYKENKKMQDLIGFRVVVYFNDDINVCINLLKNTFEVVSETIDEPDLMTFKPIRVNLIFKLPRDCKSLFQKIFNTYPIDDTFEVQIRTVFSEGWHEVEHDMRYKCRDEWSEAPDLERALNGLVATLETCDWSMIMLFDELAYRHYQQKNWVPMIKNKFRMRMYDFNLNGEIKELFDRDHDLAKKFVKIDRSQLLSKIVEKKINIPFNINNVIYITNLLLIQDERILKITPGIIKELV